VDRLTGRCDLNVKSPIRVQTCERKSSIVKYVRQLLSLSSVNRSVMSGKVHGSGHNVTAGSRNMPAPIAMQMIGGESGSRESAKGAHATSAIKTPAPVSRRI
jgi:hypothetical protein